MSYAKSNHCINEVNWKMKAYLRGLFSDLASLDMQDSLRSFKRSSPYWSVYMSLRPN